MLTKPTIKLETDKMTNAALLIFAQYVLSMLTANPLFSAPTNPTLIQLGTMISDFSTAVTAWGSTGNRGSHVQQLAVETTRAALVNGLYGTAAYCSNTHPYNGPALSSAGFEIKSEANPVGLIGAVRDLRQVIGSDVLYNQAKIAWKRPLDTPRGAIKVFNLYRSQSPNFSSAQLIATITKASYVDLGLTNPNYYYWVAPLNTAGLGAISDVLMVSVILQV